MNPATYRAQYCLELHLAGEHITARPRFRQVFADLFEGGASVDDDTPDHKRHDRKTGHRRERRQEVDVLALVQEYDEQEKIKEAEAVHPNHARSEHEELQHRGQRAGPQQRHHHFVYGRRFRKKTTRIAHMNGGRR